MTEVRYFELAGLRPDGDTFTVEVLGEKTESDARNLAQHYADKWRARVNLYRVPFLHLGSEAWLEAQMRLVCSIEPIISTR